MTFIESLEEGRKKDGNLSIADKIISQLHDLEKNIENNYGRWAWELLQNAKDSSFIEPKTVEIWLKLTEEELEFSHNGTHFTELDIRGLINQISSKECDDSEKRTRTGRFGTGFITTHLLSKRVLIEGILKSDDQRLYKFNFLLDRNESKRTDLANKIDDAWREFFDSLKLIDPSVLAEYRTKFTYILLDEEKKGIAKKGVEEFICLIPYVLLFIPKIGKVNIELFGKVISFGRNEDTISDHFVEVLKNDSGINSKITIAFTGNELATVAAEIDSVSNSVRELKEVPKLFCDFPLMGTERFPFPVVLNSFYFNPRSERDGIWLNKNIDQEVTENKNIIEKSITLYKELLCILSDAGIRELFYIADTRISNEITHNNFDIEWYKKDIQNPLREVIKTTRIVDTVNKGRWPMEENGWTIDFPFHERPELREWLWNTAYKFNNIFLLPEISSIHKWYEIIWEKNYHLTIDSLAGGISRYEKIENIVMIFNGEEEIVFNLLNEIYREIINQKQTLIFDKYAIIPNKNGTLCKLNEAKPSTPKIQLYKDEIKDEKLIEIAAILGLPYNNVLIHSKINEILTNNSLTKKDVSDLISKSLNSNIVDQNRIKAIILLTEWFDNNENLGKELFQLLYINRAALFLNTLPDKNSLYRLMKSKTPLSVIADLSQECERQPEILEFLNNREIISALKNPAIKALIEQKLKEIQDESDRREIGESVEKVIAGLLGDNNFTVNKVNKGSDLVISLIGSSFQYEIEVKSTRVGDYVAMTPAQAYRAVSRPSNYALCVVHKDSDIISNEFVKKKARFVTDIGNILKLKVETMIKIENEINNAGLSNEDISLSAESRYRINVRSNIWDSGKSFDEFLSYFLLLDKR